MEAIIPHRGFGTKEQVIISGHVFKRYSQQEIDEKSSVWKNVWANFMRFYNQPATHCEVIIYINNEQVKLQTDQNGYFEATIITAHEALGWHVYEAHVQSLGLSATCEYKVTDSYGTGVISDIDDTLLVSHSNLDFRKLLTYLRHNAHTRKPTEAMQTMLPMLKEYNNGLPVSDFFYVSNSEWNLYEFLLAFFDLNEIPKGVYLLKTLITHPVQFIFKQGRAEKRGHKYHEIHRLFRLYKNKQFVLIGDTAQHDVALFQNMVEQFENQVSAILLHQIKEKHGSKYFELKQLLKEKDIPLEVIKK